jgi:photosystem II stability/assembly factor-like uncharacterized protein
MAAAERRHALAGGLSRILAGTRESGIWQSLDKGENWEQLSDQIQDIKSISISPHDPNHILAGLKPAAVHASKDGGYTWKEMTDFQKIRGRWWWFFPAEPPGLSPYVMDIQHSPTDPNIVIAGVELGAVVRSMDGGITWSNHLQKSLRDCHSLKFHASDGNWIYEAGGSGGGVSLSQDGGETWHKKSKGLEKKYGIVCAADPENPAIWYVVLGSSPSNAFGNDPEVYMYRTNEMGGWDPIGWQSHPLRETPTKLVTIPGNPGHIIAAINSGKLFHSKDYGDSWTPLPFRMQGNWYSLILV